MERTLEVYQAIVRDLSNRHKCWCGYKNIHKLPLLSDDHPDGYEIKGFDKKQWLYVLCPQCGYEWAIWKLGIVHPLNDK